MGGHIDCYLDCSSFYGYLTLLYLRKQRERLLAHDVTVEFYPIFLGGVNVGSGNKPPWTLPAKATYGKYDSDRAKKYHGNLSIEPPSFFPPLTLLPQRALCFIKSAHPPAIFEEIFLIIFQKLWTPPNQVDVTKPDLFKGVLDESGLFTREQVDEILVKAGEKEWKDKLLANTKLVLEQGAFGAPWMWVRNSKGEEEPFFGSDRWHFMWEYLGIPWQDIEILPPKEGNKSKL
ncbi:Thioredoxin-like protein [Glarea lozoyensis ATCC 20868]|uniref:Glutathione S-transferase kappa 1 n=2 Tax=Glarea lozoyensis TaxID=101852 RepID=S3DCH5_GLAL2|nr:Thioredoxin-like protein [Glarea lozoyensis ATCC 20868]EHL01155.1 putative Glutathione S-transferase kappa 1 [Glarea lozoyensis 74030]EPE35425.1 Thioredoxin-like protein [Glarea lozoyensis ATCC 20868]